MRAPLEHAHRLGGRAQRFTRETSDDDTRGSVLADLETRWFLAFLGRGTEEIEHLPYKEGDGGRGSCGGAE